MALSILFAAFLFFSSVSSFSEVNNYRPVIWSKLIEYDRPAFHGEIKENERVVQLRPPLSASDADEVGGARFICNYVILKNRRYPKTKPVPFEIIVTDKLTGAAEIRVREGVSLDYEKHPVYKFGIVAQDCGSPAKESTKAYVMIKVLDVDDFNPKFDSESYFAYVEEGKMYDSVVKIHATDMDGSSAFKTICNYELITANAPFEITPYGVLRNKEPLDYSMHRNFILEAVAVDCGGRRSAPVFINLAVVERCRAGWSGLPDEVHYSAGQGQKMLAEGATLRLCEDDCTPASVNVKLTLANSHIGKGCDRDTYSINSQRKLCGASGESHDLLPSPASSEWSHNVPTDDGLEMDRVFAFDGESTALEVPESVFNHTLHKRFTISTWLRHGAQSPVAADDDSDYGRARPPKEHIVCMSDGDGMNRHHYGLYLHGDKLVLLLRTEAEDVASPQEMQMFRPAEFRWRLPSTRDNAWHHYALNVDLQDDDPDGGVELYIDGQLVVTDEDNFEIIDDWPLHRTKKVHSTKLVVGACWQGGENTFDHYYQGYMAGLFILSGKTETEKVIRCLNDCKENLDFHAIGDMSAGTSVSFNSDMTEFTISSRTVGELNRLMSQVAYVNSRSFPTPGYRNLTIETSIICEGETVVLPQVSRRILVAEQREPMFVITGYSNLTRMVYEFELGLRVFHDIRIFARAQPMDNDDVESSESSEEEDPMFNIHEGGTSEMDEDKESGEDETEEFLIDECTVVADPPLNLFIEHLSLPSELMETHGLEWSETNNGVVIRNADSIPNYETVIRNIHYYHNQPENLANRTLTLSCSSQNHRFTSTKFIERLVAVHQAPPSPRPANMQHKAQAVRQTLRSDQGDRSSAAAAGSNVGMAAIIVVCVGFLLFMMVLGVVRIRSAHRRTQTLGVDAAGQDMEWDNSELNITINPLEREMFEYEDGAAPTFPEDSESEEEESSMQGDYGDSTDDDDTAGQPPGRKGDLEWDNTSF